MPIIEETKGPRADLAEYRAHSQFFLYSGAVVYWRSRLDLPKISRLELSRLVEIESAGLALKSATPQTNPTVSLQWPSYHTMRSLLLKGSVITSAVIIHHRYASPSYIYCDSTSGAKKMIPPFQTTFAVPMHCDSCVEDVSFAVNKLDGEY